MPLRDHFIPAVWTRCSWEGFYGGWPAMMVQRLVPHLPDDFTAEPRVHLGSYFEIDVCAYEDDEPKKPRVFSKEESGSMATGADLVEQYEYEVLVYDQSRGRQLVAAVEIVSPANKDRPENRRAFVTKCAALLEQGVCVSLVDLVTTRKFNLYADLLDLLGRSDPAFTPDPPSIYAVTCRCRKIGRTPQLGTWAYPLVVGQPLPTLPIWLSDELYVPLELEASYEETCRVLRIP
jgi:hypothetical protein